MKLEHKKEASFKPQKHQLGCKCNVSHNNFSTNATLVALVWLTLALTLALGPQLDSLLFQGPPNLKEASPQVSTNQGHKKHLEYFIFISL